MIALRLERLICNPAREQQTSAHDLILEAIQACDPELFQLLGEAIIVFPDVEFLPPLWATIENDDLDEELRVAAFTGIAAMLVTSLEEVEDPFLSASELGLSVLTVEEVDELVARLLRIYRSAEFPSALRRRALETAANVSADEAIRAAGFAALNSDDPDWTVTGVLVVSLTEGQEAREHIEKALTHDALDVRLEAIYALASFATSDDLDTVAKIIRRGGEEARIALIALSDVPEEKAGLLLYQATESCPPDLEEEAHDAYELWLDSWAGFEPDLHESVDIGDDE